MEVIRNEQNNSILSIVRKETPRSITDKVEIIEASIIENTSQLENMVILDADVVESNISMPEEIISSDVESSKNEGFILANTEQVTLSHLRSECIIPVYCDNETTISHYDFIKATAEVVNDNFQGETITAPCIKISHVIKGRVPSAIGKAVKELTPEEKTIYYQRCAFIIEVPSIKANVNGNMLSLTIGGVRALNQENLYSKRTLEKFKVFIGFKNSVCTNLCISTDGLQAEMRVGSIDELKERISELINSFDQNSFLDAMQDMSNYVMNEKEFAHIIGKMRMYQFMSKEEKQNKPVLKINDNQINIMVKNYYTDPNFSRNNDKKLSLWSFYNLMTEANKSSYIDSNLERNANTFDFVSDLGDSIVNDNYNWFLN